MDQTRIKILAIYAACGISGLLLSAPSLALENLSLMLILISLLLTYFMRSRVNLDTLDYQHFSFIIRTMWIYQLIAVVCITAATYQIYQNADSTAIDAILSRIYSGDQPSHADMKISSDAYMQTNKNLILSTMMLYTLPAQFYLLWRLTRGSLRAYKNYRVHNLYSWF